MLYNTGEMNKNHELQGRFQMFRLEYGVKGAHRIHTREYDSLDEAIARANRWGDSNSTGHYWAVVIDAKGNDVYRVNL
jgi:hypothetical protein